MCFRILATHCARALQVMRRPRNQRAQGMPDARCTRGLVCDSANKAAHEHTGQRRTSDIPCAVALRLISCSPQSGRARCHCRSSEALASLELDASKRGVRTTRPHRTPQPRSSVATSASTATRPTFVTMANAPLSRTGCPKICSDLAFGKSEIFFISGLDTISDNPK